LYDQYILERYKGSKPSNDAESLFDKFKTNTKDRLKSSTPLQGLTPFSQIDDEHPAKQYLNNRKLPKEYFDRLYYCDRFQTYVNKVRPGTFDSLNKRYEHPRLIIPFYDVDNNVFAIQGRAFGKEQPKYLTLKLQENKQKIFGLERVNLHKRLYVVEGPLDSLFLDNCIAAGGADLQLPAENKDVVFIFDNEPRNKEIIDRMYKLIDKDYMIVIWPEGTKEKDINEMIIKGKTKEDLQKIISDNTYSGLSALTQLNSYKRI
jgi:hypothetical protein